MSAKEIGSNHEYYVYNAITAVPRTLLAGSKAVSLAALQGAALSAIPTAAAYAVTKNWRFAVSIVGARSAGILVLGILVLPILFRAVKLCCPCLRGSSRPMHKPATAVPNTPQLSPQSPVRAVNDTPLEPVTPPQADAHQGQQLTPSHSEQDQKISDTTERNSVKTVLLDQSFLDSAKESQQPNVAEVARALTNPSSPELGRTLDGLQKAHKLKKNQQQRQSLTEEEGENKEWRAQFEQFKKIRLAYVAGTPWTITVAAMTKLIDQGCITRTKRNDLYKLILIYPTQSAKARQLEAEKQRREAAVAESENKNEQASNSSNAMALYKGGLIFLKRVQEAQRPETKQALYQAACEWLKAAIENGIKEAVGPYGYTRIQGASGADPKEFFGTLLEEAKNGEDKEGWAALAVGLHALKPKNGVVDCTSAQEFLKKAVDKNNLRAEEEYIRVQAESVLYQEYDQYLQEVASKDNQVHDRAVLKLAGFLKKGFLPPHADVRPMNILISRLIAYKIHYKKHIDKGLAKPLTEQEIAGIKQAITIFCQALYSVGSKHHELAQQLMKEGKEKQARDLFAVAAQWLNFPSMTITRSVGENLLKKCILFARSVAERTCEKIDEFERDIFRLRLADADACDQNEENNKSEYLKSADWLLFWYSIREKWHLEGPAKDEKTAKDFAAKKLALQEQLEEANEVQGLHQDAEA